MVSKALKIALVFLFLLFFSCSVQAAESLSVVINEIAWMGTENSYNDEWIELYNNSSSTVNLDGGKLQAEDGTPEINLKGEIPEKEFFLLERTDDETVPGITADLIYKGSLKNDGEHLKLIDAQGEVADEVDCSTGWFSGDNKTKQTMERKSGVRPGSDPTNWQSSGEPGGTPRIENSQSKEAEVGSLLAEPGEAEEPVTTSTEATLSEVGPPEQPSYPSNIFVNEVLPSPEGADAENEWIELFNENNFEVALSGWKIRDIVGATKTYSFLEGTKIAAESFLILPRPETKITLQNSGDSLELLNPKGEVVHKASFEKAPLNQSFNRTSSGWAWSITLTPGKPNIITLPEILKTEQSEAFEEEERQTKPSLPPGTKEDQRTLAKIGEEVPKSSNPLIVFLVALIIAVGSGVVVLILKKKSQTEA